MGEQLEPITRDDEMRVSRDLMLRLRDLTDQLPGNLSEEIDQWLWINEPHENEAVSPAPAGEEIRERAAKAAYDSQKRWRLAEFEEVPFSEASELTRQGYLEVADAVLAVLNGEGER